MKKIWLCIIFCHSAFGASVGLELLPRQRPFRLTFADPREVKMSLRFEGESRISAAIGNYFSIFSVRPVEESNWDIHFGLEGAGYFSMRKMEDRFPLETADGLVGTYLEGSIGIWQWQFRFAHISAHLADGYQTSGELVATPYSREYLMHRQGILPIKEIQLYGGISYILNSHPIIHPWFFQTGISAFVPSSDQKLVPFLAVDAKWKQDTVYNPSLSGQLGIALNNPPEAYRSFRFFYAYYTGADPRGQFYLDLITTHSVGLEMQI